MYDEPRFAIYFAPQFDSPLSQFAYGLFGFDPVSQQAVQATVPDGIDREFLERVTRRPCHYGFHATLKAPFRLKAGRDRSSLIASLENFVDGRTPFDMPGLIIKAQGAFVVLGAKKRASSMDALAADCVRSFDGFRAPMNDAERERRLLADSLSARQKSLLEEWGYPYVLDQFDFHMTLAGPEDGRERDDLVKALSKQNKALLKTPLKVDGISLFQQDPGQSFSLVQRFAFSG